MIIFLLAVAVAIACGVLLYCYRNRYVEWDAGVGIILIFCCLVIFLSLISFACHKIDREMEKDILLDERAIIVYQIEHKTSFLEDSRVGVDELLYTQIKDFNANVKRHRHYRNNPWISWYEQPYWNEIELIELEGS